MTGFIEMMKKKQELNGTKYKNESTHSYFSKLTGEQIEMLQKFEDEQNRKGNFELILPSESFDYTKFMDSTDTNLAKERLLNSWLKLRNKAEIEVLKKIVIIVGLHYIELKAKCLNTKENLLFCYIFIFCTCINYVNNLSLFSC